MPADSEAKAALFGQRKSSDPPDPRDAHSSNRRTTRSSQRFRALWKYLSESLHFICLLALVLLVVSCFYIFYNGDRVEKRDGKACVTPFGAVLGAHNGVQSYSNCHDDYVSELQNPFGRGRTNSSGLKWQCVEYARRYWMLRGTPAPAVFDSVVGAADIWQLDHAELMSGLRTPLLKYANGLPSKAGGSAPRVGDLLIYPRQPGFPYGHVAVVVGLSSDSVLVAEQNWSNDYWPLPHRNYSRRIPMQLDPEDQSYTIVEGPPIVVTGWVRSG